jgi:hypothetical protein
MLNSNLWRTLSVLLALTIIKFGSVDEHLSAPAISKHISEARLINITAVVLSILVSDVETSDLTQVYQGLELLRDD